MAAAGAGFGLDHGWEAVPIVVAEALAGGRPTFWANVTSYLNLKGITLPEILSTLADLFA